MIEIDSVKKEYKEVLEKLNDPELISNWEKLEQLNKKRVFLEKIIQKGEELAAIEKQIKESEAIVSAQEDPELVSLAQTELTHLLEEKKKVEKELKEMWAKEKESERSNQKAIVEIRAGVGGEEAALFAADLFRMYSKFADSQGWKMNVLHCRYSDIGGIKEIIFELKGKDVLEKMKYEGGVHRVQRVPKTEKSNRIHTSTATVAVLPKPKKAQIKIRPEDLKIDYYKASGPGGQYVNKRMTAVRVTHLPTGIVVSSQTQRNLAQNKENALAILEAKLLEMKEEKETEKMSGKRRAQIGQAQRAEKIRTYNFPQDRVTDHRIKKNFYDIESIMDGNLKDIIDELQEKLVSQKEKK